MPIGASVWLENMDFHPSMISALEEFHHRIARHLTRCFSIVHGEESDAWWEYPDHAKTLEEAGFYPIQWYIAQRRQKLAEYAVADSQWNQHVFTAAGSGAGGISMITWIDRKHNTSIVDQNCDVPKGN